MKKCTIALVLFLAVSCRSSNFVTQNNAIRNLEIYYVPFALKTEAQWTEFEVRDTSISYVSFFCTKEDMALKEFSKCFLPSQFEAKPYIDGVPPYMLIDIIYESGEKDKLILGPNIFLEYNQKAYLISKELKNWVDIFVPRATFPSGRKSGDCD